MTWTEKKIGMARTGELKITTSALMRRIWWGQGCPYLPQHHRLVPGSQERYSEGTLQEKSPYFHKAFAINPAGRPGCVSGPLRMDVFRPSPGQVKLTTRKQAIWHLGPLYTGPWPSSL